MFPDPTSAIADPVRVTHITEMHSFATQLALFNQCIVMKAIRATAASKISTSVCRRRARTAAPARTWRTTTSAPAWRASKVGK